MQKELIDNQIPELIIDSPHDVFRLDNLAKIEYIISLAVIAISGKGYVYYDDYIQTLRNCIRFFHQSETDKKTDIYLWRRR